MRYIYTIILLFSVLLIGAQGREKRNAKFTIRGNIGIPKPISSKMYRTTFTGVYEGNLSVNVRLFGSVFAGLGYQNSHFLNNPKIFVFYTAPNQQYEGFTLAYDTRHVGHGIFVKLGADRFFSDKGYMSYSLNSGLMLSKYINVIQDSAKENLPFIPTDFNSPFIQPELAVNFRAEQRLSFSVFLSYTTLLYKFDPKAPRFAHFGEINRTSNRYFISWFNIGFGFSILLGKDK